MTGVVSADSFYSTGNNHDLTTASASATQFDSRTQHLHQLSTIDDRATRQYADIAMPALIIKTITRDLKGTKGPKNTKAPKGTKAPQGTKAPKSTNHKGKGIRALSETVRDLKGIKGPKKTKAPKGTNGPKQTKAPKGTSAPKSTTPSNRKGKGKGIRALSENRRDLK
jgi:hypothetical protein